MSSETASRKEEEGGDDVKSSWPLCPGLHTRYNGRYNGLLGASWSQSHQSRPQLGLQAATRLHERGIASNRSLVRITSDSNFMQASCSLQSELRSALMGLASSREFATHCTGHCSVCVAQGIRAMLT